MIIVNGKEYHVVCAATRSPYVQSGLDMYRSMKSEWILATIEIAKDYFVHKKGDNIDIYTDKPNVTSQNFRETWQQLVDKHNGQTAPQFEASQLKWKGEFTERDGVWSFVSSLPATSLLTPPDAENEEEFLKRKQAEIFRQIFG